MSEERNYPSRAEEEALDVLAQCLRRTPLPEEPDVTLEEQAGLYRMESAAARSLHCIGLVSEGKIIPFVDLSQLPEPQNAAETMTYLAYIARTVLDALMVALPTQGQRPTGREQNHQRSNEDQEPSS